MHIFQHHLPDSLNYICESVTTEEGRYYSTPGGRRYPSASSVTSLINKDAIEAWRNKIGKEEADRISNMACRRGTDLHAVCEKFLKNELTPFQLLNMNPLIKELFIQLKGVLIKNVQSIYCVEHSLYSDELKMAGKTDGIVLWNGKPTVIDFKTSKKIKKKEYIKNYLLQSTAYALMFEERTGIKINDFILLISVEGERNPQIVSDTTHPYIDELMHYRDMYWNLHGSKFAY